MLLTFCRPDSAHLHKRALGVGPCRDGGDGECDPAPQTAICEPFFSAAISSGGVVTPEGGKHAQ